MTTTTWSSTLNFGPGSATVLTNGNLTVDRTGGTNWVECLSTTNPSTGLLHMEFSIAQHPYSTNAADGSGWVPALVVGPYDNGVSVVSNLIYPGSTTHGVGWRSDGTTFQASGLVMPAMAKGQTYACEIDHTNVKIWFGAKPFYLQWTPSQTFGGVGANNLFDDAGLNVARTGGGNWISTKALPSQPSGNLHVEFTVHGTPSTNVIVGLVNGAFDAVGTLQYPGFNTAQGFGYQSNGTTFGCSGLVMPALADGDTVAIEWDSTHTKVWMQSSSNGLWNNDVIGNQNPATNTGGFSVSTIAGALFPCAAFFGAVPNVTLNGEGSFVVGVSSGFQAWDFSASAVYWNNDVLANQNPATNTGGISLAGLSGGAYMGAAIIRATVGKTTAQFDIGSGFALPISAGFTDWDGSAPFINQPLVGVAGTGAVGMFSSVVPGALVGVFATGAVGDLAAVTGANLAGVSATGAVGTFADALTGALTGVFGQGMIGDFTIQESGSFALVGVSARGQVGVFTGSVPHPVPPPQPWTPPVPILPWGPSQTFIGAGGHAEFQTEQQGNQRFVTAGGFQRFPEGGT